MEALLGAVEGRACVVGERSLNSLRAKGTLISEPQSATPCDVRFFPPDTEKMAKLQKIWIHGVNGAKIKQDTVPPPTLISVTHSELVHPCCTVLARLGGTMVIFACKNYKVLHPLPVHAFRGLSVMVLRSRPLKPNRDAETTHVAIFRKLHQCCQVRECNSNTTDALAIMSV